MGRKYYIKATLEKGISGYDQNFIYRLGIIVHPSPDKTDKSSCGIGIHLAKSLEVARHAVPKATEFYLAEPGVILGEDNEKVRCASCNIIRKLTKKEIRVIEKWEERKRLMKMKREERERHLEKLLGEFASKEPVCGKTWLLNHISDYTQADIDGLGIEIFKDNKRLCLITGKIERRDREYFLKEYVRV